MLLIFQFTYKDGDKDYEMDVEIPQASNTITILSETLGFDNGMSTRSGPKTKVVAIM